MSYQSYTRFIDLRTFLKIYFLPCDRVTGVPTYTILPNLLLIITYRLNILHPKSYGSYLPNPSCKMTPKSFLEIFITPDHHLLPLLEPVRVVPGRPSPPKIFFQISIQPDHVQISPQKFVPGGTRRDSPLVQLFFLGQWVHGANFPPKSWEQVGAGGTPPLVQLLCVRWSMAINFPPKSWEQVVAGRTLPLLRRVLHDHQRHPLPPEIHVTGGTRRDPRLCTAFRGGVWLWKIFKIPSESRLLYLRYGWLDLSQIDFWEITHPIHHVHVKCQCQNVTRIVDNNPNVNDFLFSYFFNISDMPDICQPKFEMTASNTI